MANLLFTIKKWLISVFNPPYQLSLDREITDESTNKKSYVFKQYGTHDFIKISYEDICKNKGMMQSIDPLDLKQIHINEYQCEQENSAYKVVCYLRNDEYVIANKYRSERHSGEYIGRNLDMFKSIDPTDLWKISNADGIAKGKKITYAIINKNGIKYVSAIKPTAKKSNQGNIINLKNVRK